MARSPWPLRPDVRFLNHGSFGSCPKPVRDAQDRWRAEMEAQPVDFLDGRLPGLLRSAGGALARFLGARGEELAFVDNATVGVNAVLRSARLAPGDEILLSDHAYPAVVNAAEHRAKETGARVAVARVPFPPRRSADVTEAFARAFTRRTRLVLVDHVTSPTALVFPAAELARLARRRGARVLVDGAHAPGMLELDVPAIGADWYVGNCHKWLCAPKGCAFLWAARSARKGLHPAIISNDYGKGYHAEFHWCGTKDPSPWLAVTEALRFHARAGGPSLRRRNRELALAAGARLAAAWGAERAPDELCGAMVSLALPWKGKPSEADAERLHRALRRAGTEVPVFRRLGRLFVRVSAQAYNRAGDYDRLERTVSRLLARRGRRRSRPGSA